MSKLKAVAMALLLVALLVSVGGAVAQEFNPDELDAFIQERLSTLDIPGAAVAVVRGDEVVHLRGYGVRNSAGDPMTPQTPFLLASLSKSITAVAVMQLVEAGAIDLDAAIQQYLPWFMPETPITVRQLLNQTSGLDEREGYQRNLEADNANALEDSIRRLATGELNRTPGEAYEYSNSNFDVLGLLVQTVSGEPYGDYVGNHIFEPLEMNHAFTALGDARAAGMSSAFFPFFGRQTPFDGWMAYTRAVQPSAGLIGSAEDMAHYLIAHLNGGRYGEKAILSPEGVTLLHKPAAPINDNVDYAMGWVVWSFDDAALPGEAAPTALSHGGDWLGFRHIMLLVPEEEMGLVLLLNSNDPTIPSLYDNIAFDAALLALGRERQNYPLQESWLDRNLRLVGAALILLLLVSGLFAWRRLRGGAVSGRQLWFFAALAAIDLALIIYWLFIVLPDRKSSVPLVLRFSPDLGVLLLVFLLLTVGWGSVRTLWAVWLWRRGAPAG